jgi:hypothetical protein
MPALKLIQVKESVKELKAMQRGVSVSIYKRLSFLIALKQNKIDSVSKRVLSASLGIDANSVTNWKRIYEQKGITGF